LQLSVVIITFNEARNIGRCLDAVRSIADDVVVVDSFSTDDTVAICRAKGVRVVEHPFEGHIEQKNYALAQARYDWVFSLDADEAPDEQLIIAIRQLKNSPNAAEGYTMNRLTNYCGEWIRHSGWYPDRKLRLFDRRKGRWGGQNPHDRVEMGPGAHIQHLKGDILHYSYYSVEEHWQRAKKYADIAAKAMYDNGKKSSIWQVWFSPIFKFLRNYVLKAGFLDGRAGWTICVISATETLWKYQKLQQLHKNN
jgi:glycosyltransferase involved in cell wall biosynthesis